MKCTESSDIVENFCLRMSIGNITTWIMDIITRFLLCRLDGSLVAAAGAAAAQQRRTGKATSSNACAVRAKSIE